MAENDILGEKLQSILSNPDSLKSIMQIASSLGIKPGDKQSEHKEETTEFKETESIKTNLQESVSLPVSAVKPGGIYSDDRMNLLLSIKPFLNEKKRQRIDSVIKAMQAAKFINAYKDSDLFSNFGLK